MEELKKPASILSIANSIGLLALSAYCYQSFQKQANHISRYAESLTKIREDVDKLEGQDEAQMKQIKRIKNQIINLDAHLSDLPEPEDLKDYGIDIEAMIKALGEKDIKVPRPSDLKKSSRRDKRSRKEKKVKYESEEETDESEEEEVKPVKSRRSTRSVKQETKQKKGKRREIFDEDEDEEEDIAALVGTKK